MEWRNQFFTKHFSKKSRGIEIGASHAPIASKKDGYNISIIDHATQEDLVAKYKSLKIDTTQIEKVDYVWDGSQTLTDLIGETHSFDYIIASHLVEHTTDLLTFLQDCQNLLKPGGKLCLAIPDKRYCFDYFRFPTTTGDLLDAHYTGRSRHTPGKIFDGVINAAQKGKKTAWSSTDTGKFSLVNDLAHATEKLELARKSDEYIDIHNWMFTPASFKLLIADLQSLKLIKLSYVDELPTQGFEFFAILSAKAPNIKTPRITLVNDAMNDIKIMLSEDNATLKNKIKALNDELDNTRNEIQAMKNSKRWRYADRPGKMLSKTRRKK